LQSLTEIDPLAHEQSIITEEELRVAAEEANTGTNLARLLSSNTSAPLLNCPFHALRRYQEEHPGCVE
jgi:hypothetical protein